jgi:hypothetical protein
MVSRRNDCRTHILSVADDGMAMSVKDGESLAREQQKPVSPEVIPLEAKEAAPHFADLHAYEKALIQRIAEALAIPSRYLDRPWPPESVKDGESQ